MANHHHRRNTHRIFLGFFPYGLAHPFFFRLRGLTSHLVRFFPDLGKNLKKTGLDFTPEDYFAYGLISYIWFALIFGGLMTFVGFNSPNPVLQGSLEKSILIGALSGFALLFMFIILMVMMPRIQAKSKAKEIDKTLLYAMKDLLLQVNAGGTLYSAMVSIAESGYGEVSNVFDKAVRDINVGRPMKDVLEELINTTDSEYLRRSLWQMIASLRAGADLRRTLGGVIEELNDEQKSQIMSYSRELNLWSLFYMMFAVAIPTIGSTMLVILSTFAGFGVTRGTFIFFIIVCFFVQVALIMFVKTRRPVVQF